MKDKWKNEINERKGKLDRRDMQKRMKLYERVGRTRWTDDINELMDNWTDELDEWRGENDGRDGLAEWKRRAF